MSRGETGRLAVKLHFIVEKMDSQYVPWELIADSSSCENPEYPLEDDIGCFVTGVWPLPDGAEDAKVGDRYEVRGNAEIVFSEFWTDGGMEYDADIEYGGATCRPTDAGEIEGDCDAK